MKLHSLSHDATVPFSLNLTPSIPIDSRRNYIVGKLPTAEDRPSGDEQISKGCDRLGADEGKNNWHVLGIVILAAGIASHGTHARHRCRRKITNLIVTDIQPVR